eukprot:Tamp_28512.p1 GENE.Tamp_28512~~Tamp_28512.p1  ORF type:complete len:154 (+),score=9.58 Tamp_28512:276-737(+)
MSGTPIEGEHWVEVDLETPSLVSRVLIDWESAYSNEYSILGRLRPHDKWMEMANPKSAHLKSSTQPKHVVHEFDVPEDWKYRHMNMPALALTAYGKSCQAPAAAVRYVRLEIKRRATQWGVSVWRFQLYGSPVQNCNRQSVPESTPPPPALGA